MPDNHELVLAAAYETSPDPVNGSIYFIGTATVIIRFGGFVILTDPNFLHAGDHVHLGYGLTSRRLTNPAMEIDQLPALDFCLLSHYHGDHFDRIAEERLNKDLPILTTRHAATALAGKGFRRTLGLNTWDTVHVTKGESSLRLTSLPGRHAPVVLQAFLPTVMGSMIEFLSPAQNTILSLYITGDTLLINELREIPRRYPDIDIALLHLGGTMILGLLMVTMDAKQGVEALRIIKPDKAIPIHYNDYTVFKSPIEDFRRAAVEAGFGDKMTYLSHGETYNFHVRGEKAGQPAEGNVAAMLQQPDFAGLIEDLQRNMEHQPHYLDEHHDETIDRALSILSAAGRLPLRSEVEQALRIALRRKEKF